MNVGPIKRRLIDADQGMFLSPGDLVVGVCQDNPSSKLVIVVKVMPPSECWFRIDKLSVLNTQQLGSTIVFSTGISDAGAVNVYIRLRVDGAWKVRAEFDSLLPVHRIGLREVGESVHVRVDA